MSYDEFKEDILRFTEPPTTTPSTKVEEEEEEDCIIEYGVKMSLSNWKSTGEMKIIYRLYKLINDYFHKVKNVYLDEEELKSIVDDAMKLDQLSLGITIDRYLKELRFNLSDVGYILKEGMEYNPVMMNTYLDKQRIVDSIPFKDFLHRKYSIDKLMVLGRLLFSAIGHGYFDVLEYKSSIKLSGIELEEINGIDFNRMLFEHIFMEDNKYIRKWFARNIKELLDTIDLEFVMDYYVKFMYANFRRKSSELGMVLSNYHYYVEDEAYRIYIEELEKVRKFGSRILMSYKTCNLY